MKRCPYCGREYPDDVAACAVDRELLVPVQLPLVPGVELTQPEVLAACAKGRLSLGSFIKLSVIASIGCVPIPAVLFGLAFLAGLAYGPAHSDDLSSLVWLLLFLKFIASAVSIAISGFLAGLLGYPFYSWLCHRRGGIVLNGRLEIYHVPRASPRSM
ncbi:MAG: hypothetical protein U1F98_14775 [Verrucomicrobiota bacterium]